MYIPDVVVTITAAGFTGIMGWLGASLTHQVGTGKRLVKLQTEMTAVKEDVSEIRKKVFNGWTGKASSGQ
jgi:hypothetical protein